MNKFKKLELSIFILGIVAITCFSLMNKSYSYGASSYITGENGSYVLQFYDIDSGEDISCSAAQEFYGMTKYQKKKKGSTYYYFYNCKQTSQSTYDNNYPKELADIRVRDKGDSAYRVSSTATAKQAYDHIYQNHRTGKFSLEWATNETIDWDAVEDYVMQKYGVTNYKQNYYSYSVKGEWEPIRYNLPNKTQTETTNTVEVDMWRMRITGDELKVTEAFVNKLLPLLKGNGTDYEKVLASYQYLKQYTKYLVDTGFNNGVDSNTSIYDAFIERETTCIGYSIAFSYLMDKLGVESYIVDQISFNNPATEEFGSVHTYNIVKVDGKFYKLDLTGGAFLTGLTSSTLYDSKLPISTSKYNTSGKKTTWSFNKSTIDGYLSSAKQTKTTTTKKVVLTTTKRKTTSVKVNSTTTTTKKKTTTKETTTSKAPTTTTTTRKSNNTNSNTTTTTTTNKYSKPTTTKPKTQIITYTVTNTHGQTEIRTSIKTVTTTTKTNRPQKTKKTTTNKNTQVVTTTQLTEQELQERKEKATINMFLFCIGITVLIVYLTYRSYKQKQKNKRYDQEVDDILRNYRGR